MSAPSPSVAIAIDPVRLAPGAWCHHADRQLEEGDIHASYSADRIGMDQPVRRPFRWQGGFWICTSFASRRDGPCGAEAYLLVHPEAFAGQPTSYREKTRDGDAARADPSGFYHGMTVRQAGAEWVLCGPPVTFVPGEAEQMSLL